MDLRSFEIEERRGQGTVFPIWPAQLQRRIALVSREFPGEVGLLVKDLTSGQVYATNAHTPFYLASTTKICVLVTLHHEIQLGRLTLEQKHVVQRDDFRDGSSAFEKLSPGSQLSIAELQEMMMNDSDNAATDILYNLLGAETINRVVRRLGFEQVGWITSMLEVRKLVWGQLDPRAFSLSQNDFIELRELDQSKERLEFFSRKLGRTGKPLTVRELDEAYERFYASSYNTATLWEIGRFLEAMYRGEILGREIDGQMLALMRGCRTGKRRLEAGFPQGRVLFAHKTGTQYRCLCDLGIAELTDGPTLFLGAYVRGYKETLRTKAEEILARLGAAVIESFPPRPRNPVPEQAVQKP